MADINPPDSRGGRGELHNNGSEAAQKRPQPALQPLRPAMVIPGLRSDADVRKDSDSASIKSGGASKGMSACPSLLFAYDCDAVQM